MSMKVQGHLMQVHFIEIHLVFAKKYGRILFQQILHFLCVSIGQKDTAASVAKSSVPELDDKLVGT